MEGRATSRRAPRKAASRHPRARVTPDARQLALDFDTSHPADATDIEHHLPGGDAPPARAPAIVLDGTGIFARAAEERARAAMARGTRSHTDVAAALEQLGASSPSDTMTAEQWFEIACELEAESPAEARTAYHRALELVPDMLEAHINLGRSYHEAEEWEQAEAHYQAAAQCDPADPIVWFNLGVLLEDRKRAHEAIIAYRRAIQSDPNHGDAHYNLGLLLDSLGRRAEAMTHLMRAREISGTPGSS
jgi:tetratricopeptide (TPR) repeat protein